MAEAEQKRRIYEFDHFRVDAEEGLLWRDGEVVPLTPKAFEMLLMLVENHGHVVKKEELMARVWPDTFVEEANLTNNISLLRKVMQGEGGEQHYIKTVPRRGYRFVANLRVSTDESAAVTSEGRSLIQSEADLSARDARTTEKHFSSLEKFNWRSVTLGLAIVVVLALLAFGISKWRERQTTKASLSQISSLAVLPLDNISGESGQEYFSDGMTDALISELAQISSLRVISRTSMMNYKGARKPAPDIGRELNVDALIDGTVVRSGTRMRITVNLIQAATDQHLWTKSYERDLGDVLALQSEIGRDVANEIKAKLTPPEQTRLQSARRVNPEAHEAYLKGVYYFNQGINERSEETLKQSSKYFEQAIQIDPNYAQAYADLSASYHWIASYGLHGQEFYPKAKSAALRAIELDDTLAHGSLAFILYRYDWDWSGAEREFKRAIDVNPNSGHHGYALYLSAMGRHEEAIAEIKLAEERDPLVVPIKRNMGLIYLRARQYDRAIEQFRKTFEFSASKASDAQSHVGLGEAYVYKGMYEEAVAEMREATELSRDSVNVDLAWADAMAGQRDEARKILHELEKPVNAQRVQPGLIAAVYAALSEKDQAFAWLEKAFQQRSQLLASLKVYQRFDSLRSDPRFQVLLRRVGLPQ